MLKQMKQAPAGIVPAMMDAGKTNMDKFSYFFWSPIIA